MDSVHRMPKKTIVEAGVPIVFRSLFLPIASLNVIQRAPFSDLFEFLTWKAFNGQHENAAITKDSLVKNLIDDRQTPKTSKRLSSSKLLIEQFSEVDC